MGFLDQFVADGLVPSGIRQQIRDAYPALLEDYKRRDAEGERFALTDMIAYQFLLATGGSACSHPTSVETQSSRPRASTRFHQISATSQPAESVSTD